MAYKVFQNGFPLPASDLNNYLMNQSVIVFASSAARSSTLPTPTEGMVTYLEDTNKLEVFVGSPTGWVDVNDNAAAIPKSTVTAAGDLIVANGNASVTRLGIGASQGLLYVNGTTPGWLAKGTDNQVLTVSSGNLAWTTPATGGLNRVVFTSSGTWTVPAGITAVSAYVMGGGGGGTSGQARSTATAGGIGGGTRGSASIMAWQEYIPVTPGQVWTVTVGAGGAGGVSTTISAATQDRILGTAGSISSFSLSGREILDVPAGLRGTASASPQAPTITDISPIPDGALEEGDVRKIYGKFLGFVGNAGQAGQAGTVLGSAGGSGSFGLLGNGGTGGDSSSFTNAQAGNQASGGGGAGGGAAASSTAITTTGGNSANATANSGSGGGGGGAAQALSPANVKSGNGGNGGSGFVALVF